MPPPSATSSRGSCRAGAAGGASLLRSHALLTRSTFPPSEVHLDDLAAAARLADTGVLAAGCCCSGGRVDAPPPPTAPTAAAAAAGAASAAAGGAGRRRAPAFLLRRPRHRPPAGRYAAIDTSWHKAGMLLLVGDGGASGEGLLECLQSSLHFSLAVPLPAVVRDASAYDVGSSPPRAPIDRRSARGRPPAERRAPSARDRRRGGGADACSPSSPPVSRRAASRASRWWAARTARRRWARSALCPHRSRCSRSTERPRWRRYARPALPRAPP